MHFGGPKLCWNFMYHWFLRSEWKTPYPRRLVAFNVLPLIAISASITKLKNVQYRLNHCWIPKPSCITQFSPQFYASLFVCWQNNENTFLFSFALFVQVFPSCSFNGSLAYLKKPSPPSFLISLYCYIFVLLLLFYFFRHAPCFILPAYLI